MSWWITPAVAVAILSVLVFVGWLQAKSEKRAEQTRAKMLRLAHERAAQPEEREQLLGFGALMLLRNGEPTRILASAGNKDFTRVGLIEWWGIADAQAARETIQSLIVEGHRARYQSDFLQLQAGASLSMLKSLDGVDYLRWERATDVMRKEGLSFSSTAIQTMAAYDYERIAWLARTCFYLDYISEDEMWRCLVWVAREAQADFTNWKDYAASYLMGRVVAFSGENSDDLTLKGVEIAKELLSQDDPLLERPHLWQQYPLASIRVQSEILELASVSEDAHSRRREELLGFGAVTGRAYGEPISALAIPSNDPSANEAWLANSWNVADTNTALARLEWILDTGSRFEHEDNFHRITQGAEVADLKGVDSADYVRLRQAKALLLRSGMDEGIVSQCKSMLAYDLERAAYLARIAYTIGYLDEERMLSYLRRIATLARITFESWEEYLASFLLTYSFFSSDTEHLRKLTNAGSTLLKVRSPFVEFVSPWQLHPLRNIGVLHAVRHDATRR